MFQTRFLILFDNVIQTYPLIVLNINNSITDNSNRILIFISISIFYLFLKKDQLSLIKGLL